MNDGPPLARALRACLQARGLVIEEAATPEEAREFLRKRSFDLALVDINHIPKVSMSELCHHIRGIAQQIGILLVTTSRAENSILQALEAGADDYITKPFCANELIARCHVVSRRLQASAVVQENSIVAGDLQLDLARRQFRKAGEVVRLTPTEFSLLAILMKNRGTALTHTQLLRTVWGPEYGQELEYLRSYVRLLRKKIEADPARPKYLLTEPWIGYRFCNLSNSE